MKGLLSGKNISQGFKTPKNFITDEVFKYAALALLPGYLLSFILGMYDFSVVNVVTYPIFIFFLIFWGLVALNNKVYKRDVGTLEHLFVVNKIDSIDLITRFAHEIPTNSLPHTIGVTPSVELLFLMKSIFTVNEKEFAQSFVSQKGNILSWLSQLDLDQRETFYRYYIQG
jgi:hypothetical protein